MKSQAPDWFRPRESGLQVFVRLTPGASADVIEGITERDDGRRYIKARVRAVPENGKANRSLEKLLAKRFRLPKSAVSVTGGAASRVKTVSIDGDPDELSSTIAAIIAAPTSR